MIRCEVIKDFTYHDFNKLYNIKRRLTDTPGKLYIKDTFECDIETAKYLLGNNEKGKIVIKILEIIPENTSIK